MIKNYEEMKSCLKDMDDFIDRKIRKESMYTRNLENSLKIQLEVISALISGIPVFCCSLKGWYKVDLSSHLFDFEHNQYKVEDK